jgi:hypothetical protein
MTHIKHKKYNDTPLDDTAQEVSHPRLYNNLVSKFFNMIIT